MKKIRLTSTRLVDSLLFLMMPTFVATIFSITTFSVATFPTTTMAAEEKTQDQKPAEEKWDVNHPPGEAYFANIDVTQGTWMNLDVSPDGKTLIFDLLGDLYTLPISGGEAKPLTHSIAWEMQPKFSPNGKQIAFTSDRDGGDNIWVMDLDGTNLKQVTKEKFRLLNSPAWSPDGKYIAAKKHFTSRRSLGAGEIWLYHVAGGSGLQLNQRPNDQKDIGEPSFSADGKKVYFSRDSTPGKVFEYSKDSNKNIYEIFSIDRLSGKIKTEVSAMGGSVRPTPSPNGKYLAFVRRIRSSTGLQSSLLLKDLSTGIETVIYNDLDRDMQETWAIHGVYPNISWTPDSQNLIFWAAGKLHQLNRITQVAQEIPFHVKTTREMRKAVRFNFDPGADSFNTKMLRWITVRPDGKQVIFQALGQIYARNLPNGKVKLLTKTKDELAFYPSYSPDGQWVVYTSWNDRRQGAVKKIRSKGGKSQTLTRTPGKYIRPSFSPDMKRIIYQKVTHGRLFSADYDINPGIYQINAKGGQEKLITDSGNEPFYAKSGKRVFVLRLADKKVQLVSLNLAGFDPIVHASSRWASTINLSPDEQYISFQDRYKIYLMPFTPAAKEIELSPKATNLPILKISDTGGHDLSWSNHNKQLNWSLGSKLHQLTLPPVEQWKEQQQNLKSDEIDLTFSVKSDKPNGSLLLSGAKIITMKGDQVIQQGDILIQHNRIKAIGKKGTLKVPANTKRIALKGKTIIPGIVDVHWHGSQGSDQLMPQQNWMNLASLAFGVTTIHDPSNDTQEFFASAELAKRKGLIAPRMFSTGRILYGADARIKVEIDSLQDAIEHLKRLKQQGAFSVKSYNQPRRDQRQQILAAARTTQMMVVPEGGSTFQHNLSMIVDGHTGIEHSIPVAAIYDDVKQLWSQSKVGYTPTLIVSYGGIWGEHYWYQQSEVWKHPLLSRYVPKEILYPRSIRRTMAPLADYNHFKSANIAAQLQDLGVSIQLGAHGQREGLGAHWEMWMFAQGGMTPLEVIRAATIDGAKYLGMDQHIGSLQVGKLADLVVLDKDPLQDIFSSDQVNMVMVNGRLYDSKNMNEIGNHTKKREKLFFQE